MEELFAAESVRFDTIKYCFDPPESNSPRRKPNPGMLLEAAAELDVDLKRSAMIGDDLRDMEAGRNAKCAVNVLISPRPIANEVAAFSISEAATMVLNS